MPEKQAETHAVTIGFSGLGAIGTHLCSSDTRSLVSAQLDPKRWCILQIKGVPMQSVGAPQ